MITLYDIRRTFVRFDMPAYVGNVTDAHIIAGHSIDAPETMPTGSHIREDGKPSVGMTDRWWVCYCARR